MYEIRNILLLPHVSSAWCSNIYDLVCLSVCLFVRLPVWHYSITRAQSYQLESIQKRAVHITFSDTRGMSYPNVLFVANLNSLKDRRDRLSRSFFHNICKPDSCLHHLLPPSRDTSITSRLRSFTSFPHPISRTRKFQFCSQ